METQRTGPPGERFFWWGTFAVYAALGLVWAFSTPIMVAPDEVAHTFKAAAIADGQWTMSTTSRSGSAGTTMPVTRIDIPRGFGDLGISPICFNEQASAPANCSTPDGSATDRVEVETYVGAYPPTYYLLVGWPSRFLDPEIAFYAMRACSVLVAAALLASGLASARSFRRRPSESGNPRLAGVAVAGAALAITPMTLFLVASINPNGLEIAAAFCVWLSALDLLGRRDRPPTRLLVRVAISSALLATTRPLSPVMLICILATVLVLAMDRPTWRRLSTDHRVRRTAGVVGVAFVASSSLVVLAHSASSHIRWPLPSDMTRGEVIGRSLSMWQYRAEQLIGVLGNLDIRLPATLVVGWFAAVLALVVLALAWSSWRRRLVLVGLVGVSLLLPTVLEAVSGKADGLLWQGRYTLPVAVGVPIVAGWMIDRWGPRSSPLTTAVVVVGVVGAAVGQTWALLITLNRYSVGLPTSPLGLRRAVDWRGPLQPIIFLGLGIVAGAAWAAWLLYLALRPVTPAVAEPSPAEPERSPALHGSW